MRLSDDTPFDRPLRTAQHDPGFDPYKVAPAALIGLVIETKNEMLIQVVVASAGISVTDRTALLGAAPGIPWLFSDVVALWTPYTPLPPYGGDCIWRRAHAQ